MAIDLNGRVALVTGAGGGIGQHITRGLLEAGAHVVATDVNAAALTALATDSQSSSATDRLITRTLDISDAAACADAVSVTSSEFGQVDIVINNGALGMGVIRDDHMTRLVDIEELSPSLWDQFVQTNLSGAWYLTHAAVPNMKRTGWGRLITVTTSMFTMLRGRFHPYGPTKAGLEAMCAGHANEFSGTGITVNVVVPGGPCDTAMVPDVSGLPREQLVPPAAMVAPILWLCSNDADEVTGNRYIAADWNNSDNVSAARASSEAPIGWPGLAGSPVWPGGKP